MQQFHLIPHETTPCEFVRAVIVSVTRTSKSALALFYTIHGDIERLKVPPPQLPARTDELWRETCFELFLRTGNSTAYSEFNFAASGAWAAYRFDDYRQGMHPLEPMQTPAIACSVSTRILQVDVRLDVPDAEGNVQSAPAAVLQDMEGRVSYWALDHAPGKPDFHHPRAFAATLNQ